MKMEYEDHHRKRSQVLDRRELNLNQHKIRKEKREQVINCYLSLPLSTQLHSSPFSSPVLSPYLDTTSSLPSFPLSLSLSPNCSYPFPLFPSPSLSSIAQHLYHWLVFSIFTLVIYHPLPHAHTFIHISQHCHASVIVRFRNQPGKRQWRQINS